MSVSPGSPPDFLCGVNHCSLSVTGLIMWVEILTAIALVLVIEGVLPFMNPQGMRKMIVLVAQMDDATLRAVGLTSMLCGVLLLYLVR